ncbi:MAG: DUF485 domain-containing protein [Pseudomonadota bacterium]|nr:DUF485 domain-containing protein [Pseudomonadota bacterium]
MSDRIAAVKVHPKYQELVRRRTRFGWLLTAIMLVAYFGYVLLIAFNKELLARPIGNGVTSVGIPLGFGIIILGIVLTAVYVRRANLEYDALLQAVLDDTSE